MIFGSKLPPGPFPLPIVGHLFKLGNKPQESLANLAKIYGSLMTIKLGSVTTIVVSSAIMAKEVLQKHDQTFSGRTVPDAVRILKHHEVSMVWLQPSSQWRNLRKLCTSQMFTNQRLNDSEEIRLKKVKEFINNIRDSAKSRQAIDIGEAVFSVVLNTISNTILSNDITHFNTDSTLDFKAAICGIIEEIGTPNMSDYFPILKSFDLQGIRRRSGSYFEKLDEFFNAIMDQRLQSKEQNATNDLLETLLQHTQEKGFNLNHVDINSLLKDLL
ncbi:hypothetical protein AQUCO_00201290v1 [Aquilegia coerulea]|uniref:Cytochrome P450 n=1 Tax=Aquilegia coerulea TaxID=218851 RepID=A0A2G5F781_AQUCA|nr:hypothetical protein AQUCO_00201290v1 [Aquilegia coerulea]